MRQAPEASLCIVTGARGAGKTTFCDEIANLARHSGWDVAGVLSPSRLDGGRKTGILAEDLRSGERRLLASLTPGEISGTSMCRWVFSEPALQWANAALAAATPCDLLIVDEIGPMELDHDQGLRSWRATIETRAYRTALMVVRSECEPQLRLDVRPCASLIVSSREQAIELARTFWSHLSEGRNPTSDIRLQTSGPKP